MPRHTSARNREQRPHPISDSVASPVASAPHALPCKPGVEDNCHQVGSALDQRRKEDSRCREGATNLAHELHLMPGEAELVYHHLKSVLERIFKTDPDFLGGR